MMGNWEYWEAYYKNWGQRWVCGCGGSELNACRTCGALVADQDMDGHLSWHAGDNR